MDVPPSAALDRARALLQAREFDAAARACAQIVAREPSHAYAWFLHGVALAEQGDLHGARDSLARSFELAPRRPPPEHLAYANLLLDAGDAAGALTQAEAALRDAAGWPPALVTRGLALHVGGRRDEALATVRRAMVRDPAYLRAHSALGAILLDAKRFDEALAVLRAACARWPSSAPLRRQCAEACRAAARDLEERARVIDAIDLYREALAIDDANADAWNDLGNATTNAARVAEAQDAYRRALERDPGYHQVRSNLLIALHYDPAIDAQAMFDAHRDWAARHAQGLAAFAPPPVPTLGEGGRLRVGFLSPALRDGPTAAFLAPLLEHLDRSRFELHGYPVAGSSDAVTERLRDACDAWHDVRALDDEAIARGIRDDGIHILVDLAGHTPGGRLLVLARKPAPVVATWLDYFDTTGVDAVDYLVGDTVSTPAAAAPRFSERVIALEPCRLCFAPPAYAPPVAAPPAAQRGFVTFASFNRLSKLAPAVVRLWSEVLAAVPASRLLLKSAALVDARLREEVAARFAMHGVDPARLEMRAHSPHAEMLAQYGDADIALDPLPYNGGLTTCEALWMGVPVLTLAGDSMIARQGASLLAAAGLEAWIARSAEEFVRIAAERAADVQALATLRAAMRERLAASPLLDAPAFARKFGDALLAMWREKAGAA